MHGNKIGWAILFVILVMVGCSQQSYKEIPVKVVQDKIYASWLGQIIGNIYGLPHENAHIDKPGPSNFPYGYGSNLEQLKKNNGAFSDDDTDIEYMYLLQMEKYGPEPTYAQLAEAWKYHVRERVWLANRAALGLMHFGYDPPATGWKKYNPHWFQIDPQLVNEIWGVTAPGMMNYAASKSEWAAHITNDGWGVEPTIHYGAMYAAAFFESDIRKLIDIGTNALPPDSRFAKTVKEVEKLYRKYPDNWQAARQALAQEYYQDEPLETKTIWNANLNGACGILALLYGDGDFQKTLDLACAIGFDADNQAATMAGLLGMVFGTDGLPDDLLYPPGVKWDKPFNDFYKNITRYDMPDASISDMAQRMAAQAEKIILLHGGKKVNRNGEQVYLINTKADYVPPLELPETPEPRIELGKSLDYEFFVSGGNPPYTWSVIHGTLPPGLSFSEGRLSGTAEEAGVWDITIKVSDREKSASREVQLVVRPPNLAQDADSILANVRKTNVEARDKMWLTVPYSLYANDVEVINDNRIRGDSSTFYSITGSSKPKQDYYGYRWDKPRTLGLLALHLGSMEENGGWFTSLGVEYRTVNGNWQPVHNLIVSPSLIPGNQPYNKPHFVEYLLAFEPVRTRAIRVIVQAGGSHHWRSALSYFTSITELGAYGRLPGYENLKQ